MDPRVPDALIQESNSTLIQRAQKDPEFMRELVAILHGAVNYIEQDPVGYTKLSKVLVGTNSLDDLRIMEKVDQENSQRAFEVMTRARLQIYVLLRDVDNAFYERNMLAYASREAVRLHGELVFIAMIGSLKPVGYDLARYILAFENGLKHAEMLPDEVQWLSSTMRTYAKETSLRPLMEYLDRSLPELRDEDEDYLY